MLFSPRTLINLKCICYHTIFLIAFICFRLEDKGEANVEVEEQGKGNLCTCIYLFQPDCYVFYSNNFCSSLAWSCCFLLCAHLTRFLTPSRVPVIGFGSNK